MRRLPRSLGRLGVVVAAVAAATVVVAVPAIGSTAMPGHQGHAAAAAIRAKTAGHKRPRGARGAFDNCANSQGALASYCVYKQTNGNDACIIESGSISNWDQFGCRNQDESFANETGNLVRVYFSPNYQGAWACVNNGWYSNNLNKAVYTFDNGPGDAGFGQEIWENVASSHTSSGNCSDPLPEDG